MDPLTAERIGPPAEQLRKRLPRCAVKVANSGELCGRLAGHSGAHWQIRRRNPNTGSTFEDYRASYAAAGRRLAEASRAGTDDSWWEEPDA